MKKIKDIEKCYEFLVEAREIFADLNGDSMVGLNKMARWCTRTDELINSK